MADLRDDIELLKERQALLEASAEHTRRYGFEVDKNTTRAELYEKKLKDIRNIEQEIVDIERSKISLSKQLDDLSGSFTDAALEQLGITSSVNALKEAAKTNDKDVLENSKDLASILDGVLSGEMHHLDIREKAINMGGKAKQIANEIADAVEKNPGMMKVFSVKAAVLNSIKSAASGVIGAVGGLIKSLGPIGILVFLINKVVEKIVAVAKGAVEVRKELGLSIGNAARLSFHMELAATQTTLLGGDAEKAKTLVKELAMEFGTVGEATSLSSTNVAQLTTHLGIGGSETAKLLKAFSDVSGESLNSLSNQLEFEASLAKSAGIPVAKVMSDVASNTALFARFGADGASQLMRAARAAADLGTSLSVVEGVADSILDLETSIAAELEAEMLIGRDINLDRARQLAQANDLEGLQQEIVNQVGGPEAFANLGRIEQGALASAFGLSVEQIKPFLAGDKTEGVGDPQTAAIQQMNKELGIAIKSLENAVIQSGGDTTKAVNNATMNGG